MLWQYRKGDDQHVVRQPGDGCKVTPASGAAEAIVLFNKTHEQVQLERFTASALIAIPNSRGPELLVVSGLVEHKREQLEPQTWVWLPAGTLSEGIAGSEGAALSLKDAPLVHADVLQLP